MKWSGESRFVGLVLRTNAPIYEECAKHYRIPYSRKILWEKTFVNLWKIRFSRRKLRGLLAGAAKRHHILRRKLLQNLKICESFLPLKISRYTVLACPMYVMSSLLRLHRRV